MLRCSTAVTSTLSDIPLTHALSLSLITALYCSWILATSCRKPSCCRLASTGAGTSLSSAMKHRARGTSSLCAGSDRATFMLAILTSAFCNIASTCAQCSDTAVHRYKLAAHYTTLYYIIYTILFYTIQYTIQYYTAQ